MMIKDTVMSRYTFDDSIVSDLHKDAYGSRPRSEFWACWDSYSDDEKQFVWDCLVEQANDQSEMDRRRESRALEDFEARVSQSIESGARDRSQAIEWILQAEGLDGEQDAGYVCYRLGLSYANEAMFEEHCKR
jgi:predicted Fe-S protein YdhL (DUF1289 family)